MAGDISIRFTGPDVALQTLPVALDGDHVLDLKFDGQLKLREIIIVDSDRRLGAAAALGIPGTYNLVRDAAKDCIFLEFRKGAANSGEPYQRDDVEINGESFLQLFFGQAEELVGILI